MVAKVVICFYASTQHALAGSGEIISEAPGRKFLDLDDISLPFLLVRNANSLTLNSCKCGEKTGVLLL